MSIGIGSRPTVANSDTDYQTAIVQQVIDFINQKKLGIYRMSFHPTVDTALMNSCVQYYLEHCAQPLIINYYHQYPPGLSVPSDWTDSTSKALGLLSTFNTYQNRLWLEPANERINAQNTTPDLTAFAGYIQDFINEIRATGYKTVKIVVDRWYNQPYSALASISDPENKFWLGDHHYMDQEGSWEAARNKAQQGLDLGLKLMDTEVGAHIDEYPSFTQSLVDMVNNYLDWAKTNDVGACVWMLHGVRNWPQYTTLLGETGDQSDHPRYQGLGLRFPTPTVPTTLPFHDNFIDLNKWSTINGTWMTK